MTTEEKMIKNDLGIIKLAKTLGNVSQSYKVMEYSRNGFYRYKELSENEGNLSLQKSSRKKQCIKNRVESMLMKLL